MSGIKGRSGVYKRSKEHLEKMKGFGYQKGNIPWSKGKKFPQFSGKNAFNYKNGKIINDGYIYILQPSHPRATQGGYVLRSHLIIEKIIGRYLKKGETTHHRNKIRTDDRPKNLVAFINDSTHQRFHHNPDNVKKSEIIFDGRQLK